MRTRLALVSALTVLATVTSAQAAGKHTKHTKHTKPVRAHVNPLNVSPAAVKIGGAVHIKGAKFGAHKKVEIVVYCPMWTTKSKPTATISVKTNGSGAFGVTYKVRAVAKNVRYCNVYALNTAGKTNAWDAMAFSVKR